MIRSVRLAQEFGEAGWHCTRCLVSHLEHRRVLRPALAVDVDAGGANAHVAEPLLHFGDVHADANVLRVALHQSVDARRLQRRVEVLHDIRADWAEEGGRTLGLLQ